MCTKKIQRFLYAVAIFLCVGCARQTSTHQTHPVVSQHWHGTAEPAHKTFAPPLNEQPLIVIDAGHGGEDEGTASKAYRYQEKQLTLQTARLLKQYLQEMGYRVAMTRNRDVFVPLDKRAVLANQIRGEVFVSVHYNSAPSKEAAGIEVHYYNSGQNSARTSLSKKLAQDVLNQVVEATGAKSRGVKASNFAVIRQTDMAAILVEGGFLTNPQERQKIKNPHYLQTLARGLAQGIDRYLKLN